MAGVTKKPSWRRQITQLLRSRTFMQYAAIGVGGIAIDTIVFTLLVFGLNFNPALATIISVSCAIINNFVWNARITFKKRDYALQRFTLFFSVGATGIVASALILVLFSDVFAFNPLVVKLISLPPILLGQFFLNKTISFSDTLPDWRKVRSFLWRQKYLFLVQFAFVILCLPIIRFTTLTNVYTGSPDEGQHYTKNVEFMMDNRRLAVSGQDDIDSLSNCRDNKYGPLPCLYSYQFTPPFNYITSAVVSKVGQSVGLSALVAARVASVMWGLVFITFAYLITRLYLKRSLALVATATVAFIPQVIFISTYVNQDIHSLAIGTILMYASLAYIVFGQRKLRWLFFAAFGLLFLAKYNYFATAVIPVGLLAWRWWKSRNMRELLVDLAWMGGAALLIAGPWFIRNFILYKDFFGMSYAMHEMMRFHVLGHKWPLSDINSWLLMFRTDIYAQLDVFSALFNSFFATFGYMNVRLHESFYTLIKVALVAGVVLVLRYGTKAARLMLLCMVGFIGAGILQIILNSYTYDFSFQGRYLFAILPLLLAGSVFILTEISKRKPELAQNMAYGGLVVILVLLIQSILVMASNHVTHAGAI